jgi:hypothetical protein
VKKKKKGAGKAGFSIQGINWTVKPGQDPLNLVRIGYIDIKRYFRAIYLHK